MARRPTAAPREPNQKVIAMLFNEVGQAVNETATPDIAEAFLDKLKQKLVASGLPCGPLGSEQA